MVMPDWTVPRPPKIEFKPAASEGETASLARPTDRLAAVIVDVFILLVPLFILLSAPFKRWMTASFILGAEPDFIAMIAGMVVLGVLLVVFYQAVMHRYLGATVGKYIFDLRVRPVFGGQPISFANHLLRGFVWVAEIFCLGLPMLAVFSNSRRRTLHDRVCDTVVVARKGEGAGAPQMWERGIVRGFFFACLLLLTLAAVVEFNHLFDRLKSEKGLASIIEHESAHCAAVSKALTAEPKGESKSHARLDMAMSLYAAGIADRECLESEIEHELSAQVPVGPVTYLAQAFVNADDAEVSNSYLDQVCQEAPASVECSMSRVVSKWSEEDWGSVEDLLSKSKRGSGYLEVWGIRHFMKQGRYGQALTFLDALSARRELAEFSLVQRVKALFNSHLESEADAALAQALPVVSAEESGDVSAWMCAQQLQTGCAALDKPACKDVRSSKEDIQEIDFEKTSEALSRVMALECHTSEMDYLSFSESVHDEDWRTFFRANLKNQKNDSRAAFALYSDVVSSPTAPDLIRVEALRRATQFADPKQYAALYEMWQSIESHEAWSKAGNILFTRLAEHHGAEWAVRVARELVTAEALAPKSLAVLAGLEEPAQLRGPASIPIPNKSKKKAQEFK